MIHDGIFKDCIRENYDVYSVEYPFGSRLWEACGHMISKDVPDGYDLNSIREGYILSGVSRRD